LYVPHRPLALVSGLAIGDYLLWNWSLNHSRDVLALISGLTLPPLAIAAFWLLALSIARLFARSTRRAPAVSPVDRRIVARDQRMQRDRPSTDAAAPEHVPTPSTGAGSPRKIAA
jgi:hypothetical protein